MPKPLTFELVEDTQVVITRHFDAPPALVWRAHMEPDLVRKWQNGGGDGWAVADCEIHPREGGTYRMVHQGPDGMSFEITGTFLVVKAPHQVVQEEVMHLPEPTPPNRVETLFHLDGEGTRMVMTMTLPDADTREQMLATGMMEGMELSYQQLDQLSVG